MRSRRSLANVVMGMALGSLMVLAGFRMGDLQTPRGGAVVSVVTFGVPVVALVCLGWLLGRMPRAKSLEWDRSHLSVLGEVGEEVIWDCDADGRVTYASPQSLELLGYTQEEIRSRSLLDLVHLGERAQFEELLAAGQGWRRRVFRCRAKSGPPVWLRSSAVPRLDADGRAVGYRGVAYRLGDVPPDRGVSGGTTSAAVLRAIQSSSVTTAFQPIVSLVTGRLLGAEALSRFSIPGEERTPQDWFTDAARVGLGVELELHVALLALDAAVILPGDAYVSVNLSPESLLWPGLVDVLTRTPIPPSRLVIEITEHASVRDYDRLTRALRPLRDLGIRLAVDDAGAGYASFRHILRLSPEFIKLDRSLIDSIDSDPAQRALTAAVAMFATDMQATVIAEGIETTAVLNAVRNLDVTVGQGYLLGRPTAESTDWLKWAQGSLLRPARLALRAS